MKTNVGAENLYLDLFYYAFDYLKNDFDYFFYINENDEEGSKSLIHHVYQIKIWYLIYKFQVAFKICFLDIASGTALVSENFAVSRICTLEKCTKLEFRHRYSD